MLARYMRYRTGSSLSKGSASIVYATESRGFEATEEASGIVCFSAMTTDGG